MSLSGRSACDGGGAAALLVRERRFPSGIAFAPEASLSIESIGLGAAGRVCLICSPDAAGFCSSRTVERLFVVLTEPGACLL